MTWRTSKGTFQTKEVGRIFITFPEFNESKRLLIQPDVVDVPASNQPPTFDVILGVKTMAEMHAKLDFSERTIIIDGARLPMQPRRSPLDRAVHNSSFGEEWIEPTAT